MGLVDYLDKGAQLGADAPCLTMGDADLSYGDVQRISHRVARGLQRSGIAPGDKVAVLSSNHALAFACVFGISRAGAVWCPVNPRNEASENRYVLDAFDCACVIFHSNYGPMVEQMRAGLPKLRLLVCLDQPVPFAAGYDDWLDGLGDESLQVDPPDDLAMIAGRAAGLAGWAFVGYHLDKLLAATWGKPVDGLAASKAPAKAPATASPPESR